MATVAATSAAASAPTDAENAIAPTASTSTTSATAVSARRSPPRLRARSDSHPATGGTTATATYTNVANSASTDVWSRGASRSTIAGTTIAISAVS